jgi:hypothetical protein
MVFFSPCAQSDDCASNLCSEGVCTMPCVSSSECGDFGTCEGKVCVPRPACQGDACGSKDVVTSDTSSSCAATPCKLVPPQCGCPSAEACYIPKDKPVCLPVGSAPDGAPCSTDNQCHGGAVCLSGFKTGSQCMTMCDPKAPSTCATGVCITSALPWLGVCMVDCDPVTQQGCGSSQCRVLQYLDAYVTACGFLAGTQPAGATCEGSDACAAGHVCYGGTCRAICRLDTGLGCSNGTCQSAAPKFRVGKSELGVCLP